MSDQPDPATPAAHVGEREGDPPGAADHSGAPPLEMLLACLRRRASPCEPPVGIGAFDVLYASSREVVVWYSPARTEHHPGEIAIPTRMLAAAWDALARGKALDEEALERIGEGRALGRWLLAVLAQLPGVGVRVEPSLVLTWAPPIPDVEPPTGAAPGSGETGATGATAAAEVGATKRRRKRNA